MLFSDSDLHTIRTGILDKYRKAAVSPIALFRYPVGSAGLESLGYAPSILARLHPVARESYCGVGNPFALGTVRPGFRVLDLGCGAGVDTLAAALLAGTGAEPDRQAAAPIMHAPLEGDARGPATGTPAQSSPIMSGPVVGGPVTNGTAGRETAVNKKAGSENATPQHAPGTVLPAMHAQTIRAQTIHASPMNGPQEHSPGNSADTSTPHDQRADATIPAPGEAHGVDISPDMLRKARSNALVCNIANAHFHQAELEALPFADGSFDIVLTNGALNLVVDKIAALREAHRVLRPGGELWVADQFLKDGALNMAADAVCSWQH